MKYVVEYKCPKGQQQLHIERKQDYEEDDLERILWGNAELQQGARVHNQRYERAP